ncbi:carbohydrate sulfotransferase 15-like [Haliotis asinina]|uniref:carbohydrate sulfotransferase 15-like n=1 Tax=Haliotis asinina TaxID=109174 RepID=UPI003531F135
MYIDSDCYQQNVPRPALEFNYPCWWVENVTKDHCPWTRSVRESCSSFETYLNLRQVGANFIQTEHIESSVNEYITGDAAPDYFSYNDFWDMLPGNEGCTEPCVTNADIIHHLNPRAKIILSLRNPTDRLYSFYLSKSAEMGKVASQQLFHDLVISEIYSFNDCLRWQSLRGCCYNYTIADSLTEQIDLRRGIYHVFLLDWMKVFPRKQIYIQTFEDYMFDKTKHLVDIFKFLNLRSLTDVALLDITGPEADRQKKTTQTLGGMMMKTRYILEMFYGPHNQKLATMMEKDFW